MLFSSITAAQPISPVSQLILYSPTVYSSLFLEGNLLCHVFVPLYTFIPGLSCLPLSVQETQTHPLQVVVLNRGCTLESNGEHSKRLMPRLHPTASKSELWEWDPGVSALKAPQVIPMYSLGREHLESPTPPAFAYFIQVDYYLHPGSLALCL